MTDDMGTKEAVKTLMAQLELPADSTEIEFLGGDLLATRFSTAILYSDTSEELLR